MRDDQTVLVVDDEQAITDTYREILAERYTVEVAQSGERALEILPGGTDVVLLDRRMPGMSGDEVLEEIRAMEADPRVVMITAVDPDTNIIGIDFDEYLVKPVSEKQLYDVVERMMVRNKLDEQIQQMVSTASRLATLESKLGYEQLQHSDEYAELLEEFETLRERVTLPDGTEDEYVRATVEKLEALLNEHK